MTPPDGGGRSPVRLLLFAALLAASHAVLHGRRQSLESEALDASADVTLNSQQEVDSDLTAAARERIEALNANDDVKELLLKASREGRSVVDVYREALDSGRGILSEDDPKAGDFTAVEEVPGMPKVVTGRSYVFVTHHKTGTNLMQQICNLTAMLVTGGRDQCAFCFLLRKPTVFGGRPSCVPDPIPVHGPLRGTFSRFTLVSNMNATELSYLDRFSPDMRVVHMIRDPLDMAMSDYGYNTLIKTKRGKSLAWDAYAHFPGNDMTENLRIEARAILRTAKDMVETYRWARFDPRVLTLDLDDFEHSFNETTRHLFNHMFDNPPASKLAELISASAKHDASRWTKRQKSMWMTTATSDLVDEDKLRKRWMELAEEGDPAIMAMMREVSALGYGRGGHGIFRE